MAGQQAAKSAAFDPIGVIVRDELERRGMSQAELAKQAGIEYVAVRSWLSGRRGLRSDRVALVLESLELEIVRRK